MTNEERTKLEEIRRDLLDLMYNASPLSPINIHKITFRIWDLTHATIPKERIKQYDSDIPTCCGGIALTEAGKCPICGDKL